MGSENDDTTTYWQDVKYPDWYKTLFAALEKAAKFRFIRTFLRIFLCTFSDTRTFVKIRSLREKGDLEQALDLSVQFCHEMRGKAPIVENFVYYFTLFEMIKLSSQDRTQSCWQAAMKEIRPLLEHEEGFEIAILAEAMSREANRRKDSILALRFADEGLRADPTYTSNGVWFAWLKLHCKTDDAEDFIQVLISRDENAKQRIFEEECFQHFPIVRRVKREYSIQQ